MILTFLGADHEVTVSCHFLQVNRSLRKEYSCGLWNGAGKGYLCKPGTAGFSRRN